VDIWHFGLSEMIRAEMLRDQVGIELSQVTVAEESDAGVFRLAIEALAASTLQTRSFELAPFVEAMRTLPMSYTELFSMYIGKNVLNQFRQNNGYQSGEYRKLWQGREDNEHLADVLERLDCNKTTFRDDVYSALSERYAR